MWYFISFIVGFFIGYFVAAILASGAMADKQFELMQEIERLTKQVEFFKEAIKK